MINIISKGSDNQHLVSKFGEKEYSLLSALGSQHKHTKTNALKAINGPTFGSKLSAKEKDLIKITLT